MYGIYGVWSKATHPFVNQNYGAYGEAYHVSIASGNKLYAFGWYSTQRFEALEHSDEQTMCFETCWYEFGTKRNLHRKHYRICCLQAL